MQYGKIMLVNICVIRDANAAPGAPYIGINMKFNITFKIAATTYIYLRCFCFSLHTIQAFRYAGQYTVIALFGSRHRLMWLC